MSKTRRIGQIVVLAASLLTPRAVRAQGKVEFTPFLGSFYALAKMCSDCNNDASDVRGRLQNSAAFGGRISYWLSRTVGLEAVGMFTPARIELSAQDTTGFALAASAKGTVLIASARFLYRPARTNLHFIVGAGMVRRGGDTWKFAHDSVGTKTTSPAGVIGIAVRAAVTPKFALLISAEDHLYSFDPMLGPGGNESNGSKLQSDLLISIGVPITLAR